MTSTEPGRGTAGAPPHVVDHGEGIVAVRADNPGPLTLTGTRTYVIGVERVAVLDPGPADEAHLRRVDGAIGGRPVAAVCLTHSHRDHAAAAGEAAGLWGPLHASGETLARIGLSGTELADGDGIELGAGRTLEALATPGHSGDHLCYLLRPSRDLFTGDLVLGEGSSIIVHPDGSVRAYLASLARLITLRPTRLLPGHGPAVEEAVKRLEAYRIHRLERTRHVRSALRSGARTLEEIRERVYWDLPESHHRAAELSIRAYLAYLGEEGHDVPSFED